MVYTGRKPFGKNPTVRAGERKKKRRFAGRKMRKGHISFVGTGKKKTRRSQATSTSTT